MFTGSALGLSQESSEAAQMGGGFDGMTAIFVIITLFIVFGGLVLYELIARSRTR